MSRPAPRPTPRPAHEAHRRSAEGIRAQCGVLTVSDTRTPETDTSGALIRQALENAGHTIARTRIVLDEPAGIEAALSAWIAEPLDLLITTGGTGIARRDTTIEVVERLLERRLEGFGELFRMLSWEEVGSAAMLSRATAGLAGGSLLFALPGSRGAVTLAMEGLILPELSHLVWETRR